MKPAKTTIIGVKIKKIHNAEEFLKAYKDKNWYLALGQCDAVCFSDIDQESKGSKPEYRWLICEDGDKFSNGNAVFRFIVSIIIKPDKNPLLNKETIEEWLKKRIKHTKETNNNFWIMRSCANADYAVVIDNDDYCGTLKAITDFASNYAEKISYLYTVPLFNANASLPDSSADAGKNRLVEKSRIIVRMVLNEYSKVKINNLLSKARLGINGGISIYTCLGGYDMVIDLGKYSLETVKKYYEFIDKNKEEFFNTFLKSELNVLLSGNASITAERGNI